MLLGELDRLWGEARRAFEQERTWLRGRRLLLSLIVCLGRRTMTGVITAGGHGAVDWSADYRMFSNERVDTGELFGVARREVTSALKEDDPFLAMIDDTLVGKSGKKVPGTGWRRDPLGPAFHPNFVWGQRFLQVSAILPAESESAPCRAVPVDFSHAPSAKKPGKRSGEEEWEHYRKARKELNLSKQGGEAIRRLRANLDEDEPGRGRPLWVGGDGSFTNREVLKDLPENTVYFGRIRGDARLHYLPENEEGKGKGRKKTYGHAAPRPEELRKDESIPWTTARVYAAGKEHDMKYKTLAPLLWRPTGGKRRLRLVVIAPLAYRPKKGSRLLYRKPAYLICTDPDIPAEEVIRAYVKRWEIEVNFRDEKQILGLGQAQVWNSNSARGVPAMAVAAYSFLLLAAARAYGVNGSPSAISPPKWRKEAKPRASTKDLVNQIRLELWSLSLNPNSFGLLQPACPGTKPPKLEQSLASAVLYA